MKTAIGCVLATALVLAFVGCASSDEEPVYGIGTNEPTPDAGKNDSKTIKVPPKKDGGVAVTTGDDDDSTSSSSGGSSSGGSSSGGSSGGSSSGGSSSSSSSGAVPPPPANPCGTNTCASATAAGNVSGDTGADVKLESGAASKWFTINVTEDDHSMLTGKDLYLRVTLTSPPSKNFDLYVYLPSSGGTKECSTVTKSSTSLTGDDKVEISWGEGSSPNGVRDDRTVTIEVREVVDPSVPVALCDPNALWNLKIEGDK